MASQPPQPSQSSHNRAPSPTTPTSPSSPQIRRPSLPHSTTSIEDSQTLLLNTPCSTPPISASPATSQQQTRPPPPARAPTDSDPLKCWICFADSTEDSPTSSRWTSPCPCALTAHEACLLDWVASQESSSHAPGPIQCPQCKAVIKIARPDSYVVRGLRAAQRAWELALTPIVGIGAAGGVIMVSLVHGFSSVYAVFGRQDADRLFGIDTGRRIGGGWWLSLQLIPVTLVLSRTSIADSLFPVLPLFYFMARPPTRNARSLWPPSAAMMVACLPYVRGVYYEFYKRVVKKREQAWIKEVQPRAGEDGEGAGGENVVDQGENDVGGINFELGVELEIVEEQEVMPNAAPQAAPGENRPPADQLENFFRDRQALHNHHEHHHHGGGIVISVYQLANLITGALLFPSIAASMGGLLKLALPKSWTTPPSFWNRNARQGLLQSQFGRSVVGGCLFVVLKDSLLLYSKFRLAQDHRKRRVVDYDPQKGQRARATGR